MFRLKQPSPANLYCVLFEQIKHLLVSKMHGTTVKIENLWILFRPVPLFRLHVYKPNKTSTFCVILNAK